MVYKVSVQGLSTGDVIGFVEGADLEEAVQKVLAAYDIGAATHFQITTSDSTVIVPDTP